MPTGDAAALADRMAHLLPHPETAEAMARAGRDRVEEAFSISAAGARVLRVYDELLAT